MKTAMSAVFIGHVNMYIEDMSGQLYATVREGFFFFLVACFSRKLKTDTFKMLLVERLM